MLISFSIIQFSCSKEDEEKTVVAPTITTTAATAIGTTTVTSGGNITDDGNGEITSRGVCYSRTEQMPTISLKDGITTDGTGDGVFTSKPSGLLNGTTYYLRAYATNSAGTSYGAAISFTTVQ